MKDYKYGVKITYNDGTTEFFENKNPYTFWDDCNKVLEVSGIKEVGAVSHINDMRG